MEYPTWYTHSPKARVYSKKTQVTQGLFYGMALEIVALRLVPREGGGYSKKFYTGRLPRSNPLPFYIPFFQKRNPFRIPFIGKRHPFHIPSEEDLRNR